jgi:hypothetical protein
MAKHDPIFSAKVGGKQIGYIQGNEAFDLSGEKRGNYSPQTGNLRDPHSGKIVGHVTLRGRLIGPSWIVDEFFCASDGRMDLRVEEPRLPQAGGDIGCAKTEVANLLQERRDSLPSAEQPSVETGIAEAVASVDHVVPFSGDHADFQAGVTGEAVPDSDNRLSADKCEVRATTAAPDHQSEHVVRDQKVTNSADGRAETPKKTLHASYYRHRAEILRFALITTRRPEAAVRLRAFMEQYRALADRAAALDAHSSELSWSGQPDLRPRTMDFAGRASDVRDPIGVDQRRAPRTRIHRTL